MRMFDDITRTELRPSRENEPTFEYCNISARRPIAAFRDIIEVWFQRYPTGEKAELRSRFRSRNDAQHHSAFFELYLHELLLSMGFDLSLHPDMNGNTATHPDFLVSQNGQPCFYLEATLVLQPEDDAAKERMIAQVYDSINRIESTNFFISIQLNGTPTKSLASKPLRKALERWLATLDPDSVEQTQTINDLDELPTFDWEHEDWSISFRAIAKSPELRGKPGVRPIGFTLPKKAGVIDSYTPIRRAISAKATKYGDMPIPFIVAVNVFDIFASKIDVMNALFGPEAVSIRQYSDGTRHHRLIRQPKGAWISPHGPQNTRVSAALIALNLSPWAMMSRTPTLIHHPWATRPISPVVWPLAQEIPNQETLQMEEKPSKDINDFLRLPTPWPLPDEDLEDS